MLKYSAFIFLICIVINIMLHSKMESYNQIYCTMISNLMEYSVAML